MIGKSEGFALLEAAIAASVALPIGLSALLIMALAHDTGAVQPIPEAILAGQRESVMTWVPDRPSGGVRVDTRSIEGELDRFLVEGVRSVEARTLRLRRISAKACYWVHRVDAASGAVGRVVNSTCRTQGAVGSKLTMEDLHASKLQHTHGIPLLTRSSAGQFFGEVVLWGLVVGGEFSGLPVLFDGEIISGAAVEVPRREVTL